MELLVSIKKPTFKYNKMEIWKTIENTEDIEISSEGKVRKVSNNKVKVLKLFKDKKPSGKRKLLNPYLKVNFKTKRGFKLVKVHRLVASAFCNRLSNERIWVDHINRNPIDNRADNLRWVTPKESCSNRKLLSKKDKLILIKTIINKYYLEGEEVLLTKIKQALKLY